MIKLVQRPSKLRYQAYLTSSARLAVTGLCPFTHSDLWAIWSTTQPSFVCLVGGGGRVAGWRSVPCRQGEHGQEHGETIVLHKSGATQASTDTLVNHQYRYPRTHIYNGISYSLKKGKILMHTTTRLMLGDITLSDISQTQDDKYCRTFMRQREQLDA